MRMDSLYLFALVILLLEFLLLELYADPFVLLDISTHQIAPMDRMPYQFALMGLLLR